MLIVETRAFTRRALRLLTDNEYRKFQVMLSRRPGAGTVIPQSGGLRKIRWGLGSRGKRSGIRVIYYWHEQSATLLMLFVFAKNERTDLSRSQLRLLRQYIDEEYP